MVVASVELLTDEAILGEGGQGGGAGGGEGSTVMFGGPAVDGCGGHGATGTTVGKRPSSTAQRSGNQERERIRPASAAKTSKSAASGSNSRRRQAIWAAAQATERESAGRDKFSLQLRHAHAHVDMHVIFQTCGRVVKHDSHDMLAVRCLHRAKLLR